MLSGRSAAEKAERRAAKTQSLYVATPSSTTTSSSLPATRSSFLQHTNKNSQLHTGGVQPSSTQQQQLLSPSNTAAGSPFLSNYHHNSNTPTKSPKKTRPFSMMFMHQEGEAHKQQHDGHDQQQQQHQVLNESDEDAALAAAGGGGDGQSLHSTLVDYAESDLREVDADTKLLIAQLTDLDSGLPILLERVKQNLHSCKDLVSFLKKRSVMEAEYGTSLLKLSSGMRETYRQQQPEGSSMYSAGNGSGGGNNNGTYIGASSNSHGTPVVAHYKQGSYGDGWNHILEMHERMGNNRLELSRDLQVVSEELSAIYKETDRSRKQFKEAGAKQERIVQEHEQNLDKAKQKYDTLTEEWERTILQKSADPTAPKKAATKGMTMSIFRQPKSVNQLHKQEEEARAKATVAHEQYKAQLAKTNDMRQYYFSSILPSILKNLKDTIDESDLSLQYYLMRYGYMSEDYMMRDAIILNPINGSDLGLRDRVELINKDTDLQTFIQAYSIRANPVTKSAAPYQEYLMSTQAQSIINPKPIFGCDLAEQLIRDEADLPEIVIKCTEAIERFGMDIKGIYRVSGITSATNRLRSAFDRDCSAVDLSSEENCGDINSVASVLKTWFRELPDPLLTRQLYPEFIRAANIEDPSLQLMNLHQVTNQLPDPNYATLKFLMCHLNKVQANQEVNKMGASNLGLIFGPTLTSTSGGGDAVTELADMGLQCRIIESLLNNYGAIFDIEDEDEEEGDERGYQEHGEDGVLEGEEYQEGEYGHQQNQQQHPHQAYQRGGMMVHPIDEDDEDGDFQQEVAEALASVSLRDDGVLPNGEHHEYEGQHQQNGYDRTRKSAFEEDFGPRGGEDVDGGGEEQCEDGSAEFSPTPQRA
ncbi:MAG: hypothetical protein JOS17DRAFT_266421 [Linnemannia elongata]|nr:MAG: hypothetical protein JOS17DRAFT_266421 [Linnemannia elongata]